MVEQVQALVERAGSLAELQRALTEAYGGLDSDQLVRVMAAALALAELRGMADVVDEVRAEQG
jgi:phage gp29-like protein